MNWIYDLLEELAAISALLWPALKALYLSSTRDFWVVILRAVALAIGLAWAARFFGRLWLKNYVLVFAQKAFSFVVTLVTMLGFVTWAAGDYFKPGLALILLGWQNDINQDRVWAEKTFVACYEAVKQLGIEDFTHCPHPSQGGQTIPITKSESRAVDSSKVVSHASLHFAERNPALGRLLDVNTGLTYPVADLKAQVDAYFDAGNKHLPPQMQTEMCSKLLKKLFEERSDSLVTLLRVVSVMVPVIFWLLLFIWSGRGASRQMDNLVSR